MRMERKGAWRRVPKITSKYLVLHARLEAEHAVERRIFIFVVAVFGAKFRCAFKIAEGDGIK